MKEPYERLLPLLRQVAREHGYALGFHGSGERDCDLIAAPWVEEASDAEVLIEALRVAMDGHILRNEGATPTYTQKPHGRRAWAIVPLKDNTDGRLYFDISVMPKKE
jgi:hypothetical protein